MTDILTCPHCQKQYKDEVELQQHFAKLQEMDLHVQWYIPAPPVPKAQLHGRAASGDAVTIDSFWNEWMGNLKAINEKYDVKANSVLKEYKKHFLKPCIIAGSGPSLRKNAKELLNRGEIPLVSCLHNFGYFEDLGVKPEYYMNLDSQEVTISEVYQGGTKTEEEYWAATANHTLVTVTHGNPKLLEKWRGKILFFAVGVPDGRYMEQAMKIDKAEMFFGTGGNTLGACLYMAKAVLGCNPIIFVGADFAFGYDKQFHPFKSPYDQKFQGVMPCVDIFGNRVYTWPSYFNFSQWFSFVAMGGQAGNTAGKYINCTEGGILGAWPEGNMIQIEQAELSHTLQGYTLANHLPECVEKHGYLF